MGTLGDEHAERRALMYEYVFSIFERAYLHRDLTPAIHETVWPGWDAYIRDYLRRPSFRAALETWRYDDGTFGMTPEFERYIDKTIAEPG